MRSVGPAARPPPPWPRPRPENGTPLTLAALPPARPRRALHAVGAQARPPHVDGRQRLCEPGPGQQAALQVTWWRHEQCKRGGLADGAAAGARGRGWSRRVYRGRRRQVAPAAERAPGRRRTGGGGGGGAGGGAASCVCSSKPIRKFVVAQSSACGIGCRGACRGALALGSGRLPLAGGPLPGRWRARHQPPQQAAAQAVLPPPPSAPL